jgi:tetratricopeptide (TPR) repeat protein
MSERGIMSKGSVIALFLAVLVLNCVVFTAEGQQSGKVTGDPLSEKALSSIRELRLNSGVPSLTPHAHAYYKVGVAERRGGNSTRAILAFQTASELDPVFLDPHFSLFRAYLLRSPGKALSELSVIVRILRTNFAAQYFALKNTAVMGWIVLLAASALFTAFACARHVARLRHALSERLSIRVPSKAAGVLGAVAVFQPLLWGIGAAGTILCYSGALWKCMGKRERFFGVVLLVLVVSAPYVSGLVASGFPPIDRHSPTYVSYVALQRGWGREVEASLVKLIKAEPDNMIYHFAYGTMARRAGKLGIARKELAAAVELSPESPVFLNNLGNVYFNLGDLETAAELYRSAISLKGAIAQPHFNLAQIFTKRLAFQRANEELTHANRLDSELISDFSMNSTEQLNRSVIDATVAVPRFWSLLRAEGVDASSTGILAGASSLMGIGTVRASATMFILFALSAAGGVMAFRSFYTYRCANCGKVVCRKCLKRAHRTIFCQTCGATASSLQSDEFAKLLFSKQLKIEARKSLPVSLPFRVFVPGCAMVLRGDSVRGFLLLCWTAAVGVYLWGQGYLFDHVPSLHYQHEFLFRYVAILTPLILFHVLVLVFFLGRSVSVPISLRLLKRQSEGKQVTDGSAGKSGRLQSG